MAIALDMAMAIRPADDCGDGETVMTIKVAHHDAVRSRGYCRG